ncbi:MAG: hypothetical protein M0Z61_06645 [Nitrospiraceae bacterium]|nr:hypothetical protein [Nitrospiraceae bacterium]
MDNLFFSNYKRRAIVHEDRKIKKQSNHDYKIGINIRFGGEDTRTLDFLKKFESSKIYEKLISSKIIGNSKTKAIVHEFIKFHYHKQGCGLFGRGDPAVISDLKNLLLSLQIKLNEEQTHELIETAVQRARNWGHLDQLHEFYVPELKIFEPTRNCEFCGTIAGAILKVETAHKKMISFIEMRPADFESELEAHLPVVANVPLFIEHGLLPPYHARCTGNIVINLRQ